MDPEIQHWFVLNHIPITKSRSETPRAVVEKFNALGLGQPLDVFAPTFIKMVEINGKMTRREMPLAFHYVFVRGLLDTVKQLCAMTNGFSFVIDKGSDARYLTVPNHEMEAFRIIARAYGNNLPCYSIDEISLQEGDLIEVIDGDFAGLIGTYIPKKGGRSGNIVLALSQKFATVAYDIKARYVRILQFGQNTKRAYDQIDAFIPHLLKAMRLFHDGSDLTPQLIGTLSIFCQRYELTRIDNPKTEAKLAALLVGANRILADTDRLTSATIRLEKSRHTVTNPWTIALINLILAITIPDHTLLFQPHTPLSIFPLSQTQPTPHSPLLNPNTLLTNQKLSAIQSAILAEYDHYLTPLTTQ